MARELLNWTIAPAYRIYIEGLDSLRIAYKDPGSVVSDVHGTVAAAFAVKFLLNGWEQHLKELLDESYSEFRDMRPRPRARWSKGWGWAYWPEAQVGSDRVIPAAAISIPDLALDDVWTGGTVRLHITSALLLDSEVARCIARVAGNWQQAAANDQASRVVLEARFLDRLHLDPPALPCISIAIEADIPPSPKTFAEWYRSAVWERWQHRLWDGRLGMQRRRRRDRGVLVRSWTLYTLREYAQLGLRDAIRAWNDGTPPALELSIGDSALSNESQASDEYEQVKESFKQLRRWLGDEPPMRS